ncbi:hypothetical protein J1605_020609 [Eschrichtius robustus]|uniref:Thyroglobulin type-1 domain-containing protein n=1 Tax=Eschrichtius robustus TaxID=9764 RepID=A0AB34HHB5_ESCRO|nr:hypothetical protein J1605_020609 [Eschrichtius robustus]
MWGLQREGPRGLAGTGPRAHRPGDPEQRTAAVPGAWVPPVASGGPRGVRSTCGRGPPALTLLAGPSVCCSVSSPIGSLASSCDQEQQSALEEARQPKNDNVVIPECAHGGLYKPVQCHPSTGYCWCVLVDTGRPIPGTSTRPSCRGAKNDLVAPAQLQGR